MIKSEILYTLQCDRCKKELEDDNLQYWVDVESVLDIANNNEWITKEDKHYCPDCYIFNHNDEIEVKEDIPFQLFKLKDFLTKYFSTNPNCDIIENWELYKITCYTNNYKISEAKLEMIEEIVSPHLFNYSIIPITGSGSFKLSIEIKKV